MGKQRAQHGQARCPKWARVILKICPKHFKTHSDLSKGKEQVTLHLNSSPHLASPEGEGQLLLLLINH